ncbi:ester cyclase, partial [Bacillus sp. B-TM1]
MGGKKLFGFLSLFVICIVLVACGVEEKTEVQ